MLNIPAYTIPSKNSTTPVQPITTASSFQLQSPGSWSYERGKAPNLYWAWGYVVDTYTKLPVKYPRIKVYTPSGVQYGGEYIGDEKGVWNLAIPSQDYLIDISAAGYYSYKNPAHVVSNGYRLFMQPSPSPAANAPVIQTPAPVAQPAVVPVNSQVQTATVPTTNTPVPVTDSPTGAAPVETQTPVVQIVETPGANPLYYLLGGAAVYFVGKELKWWK